MKTNRKSIILALGLGLVLLVPQRSSGYYNPSTGRWLSRDPIGEPGACVLYELGSGDPSGVISGPNPHALAANNPINAVDILGLWGEAVHRGRTALWAGQVGISSDAATVIGIADDDIDTLFRPDNLPLTDRKFSWHFNRSTTGGDSRLDHRDQEVRLAQKYCTGDADFPNVAARYLGYALHPLQDWVAHGDFDRRDDAPSLTTSDVGYLYYIHNWLHGIKKPDNPSLDSDGVDGRATIDVMHLTAYLPNGDRTYWANFHPGSQRIVKTEQLTKDLLSDFQSYVRANAKACGRCRQAFLPSN
jgi:RHS repeat-associated protein